MTHWLIAAEAAEASGWTFGWEALVAIGTLLLALATGGLALMTWSLAKTTGEEVTHSGQLVKESQRQVTASQKQVEASEKQATTAREALGAAHDQTRLAQLTLSAQIRPVLVDVALDATGRPEQIYYYGRESPIAAGRGAVHVHVDADGAGAMISVPMRNAGSGWR